ncbi:MAG: hypothetical protein JST04_15000 [Bdellovibrionales bacterium]|nr:hypothetical protein [Bdellovibrionales bacterium]
MSQIRDKSAMKDSVLRRFTLRILQEFRRTGSAAQNENLKHVRRMAREVRCDRESLERIDIQPEILETAILLSDLGKEPHILQKYLKHYDGSAFRAFLDHSRISMREGNRIRLEVGVDARTWRKILSSIVGHDGPSIPGSWWKINYERELGKRYPGIHSRDALIHSYLDRIDQGGLFRSASGHLNGGLRKISYDIFLKDSPFKGNLAGTIVEIFGNTRAGTQEQIDFLDEVVKPRLLGSEQLPKIVREMKRKFLESEKYFERILIEPGVQDTVRVVLDHGEIVTVTDLDDFWRVLAKVTPKGSVSSFARRVQAS